jgi:hypothetical protein
MNGFRQCTGHIAQPADFDKWLGFRSQEQDVNAH